MIAVKAGDILTFGLNSTDTRTYVCNVNLTDRNGNPYTITITQAGTGNLATAASTDKIVASDGYLYSAVGDQQTRATANTGPGTVIMALILVRQSSVIASLFQDYYYTGHSPQYPSADGIGGTPNQGRLVTLSGSAPAVATDISDTVPVNQRWRLRAVEAVLVTDGNAANRTVNLFIDDAGSPVTRYLLLTDTTAQTATLTRTHGWYPGTDNDSTASVSVTDTVTILAKYPMSLQNGVWLKAGDKIRTTTANIQAGDQWGAARYIVEAYFADVSGGA